MNWATPEFLDKLGTASLAVLVSGLFMVALVRGWIVLGRDHRQDLADRDRENALLRKENDKLLDSNNVLTRAVLEKNVTEDTASKLLVSFRQALEAGR